MCLWSTKHLHRLFSHLECSAAFTMLQETLFAHSSTDKTHDADFQMFAVADAEHWVILGSSILFLVNPVILWADMMVRITGLVRKDTKGSSEPSRNEE
jgi:hypothetical protein